jgi:hypothetical protein
MYILTDFFSFSYSVMILQNLHRKYLPKKKKKKKEEQCRNECKKMWKKWEKIEIELEG